MITIPRPEGPHVVFLKQKTAYEIYQCDWSSDVCSSDLCPTGASYKRAEDGIVLVDYDKCIGCGYCAWACPYGAREMDGSEKVMKKCTLCVDRITDQLLPPGDPQPACVMVCPISARLV